MKQQSAGAIALTQRVEALEKRLEAMLIIIEQLTERLTRIEQAPAVKDVPQETYQAAFDSWPNAR